MEQGLAFTVDAETVHLCEGSMNGQDNICNARAALKLVRMAIEQTCPAGVLPSEEAVMVPSRSTRAKRLPKPH